METSMISFAAQPPTDHQKRLRKYLYISQTQKKLNLLVG